jgi:hypothetical protein
MGGDRSTAAVDPPGPARVLVGIRFDLKVTAADPYDTASSITRTATVTVLPPN